MAEPAFVECVRGLDVSVFSRVFAGDVSVQWMGADFEVVGVVHAKVTLMSLGKSSTQPVDTRGKLPLLCGRGVACVMTRADWSGTGGKIWCGGVGWVLRNRERKKVCSFWASDEGFFAISWAD